MREILFRGKRLSNGKWVEGVPWLFDTPSLAGKVAMILDYGPNARHVVGVDVEPDTVGQYTGLTDKNGIRIFEGDIIKLAVRMGVVQWGLPVSGNILFYQETCRIILERG